MTEQAPEHPGIDLRVADAVAHITLNRPARLNAIGADTAHAWRAIAEEIRDRDDVRAIILDAAGPAFCAGGDVLAFAELAADSADGTVIADLADVIHAGHEIFESLSIPIVAAVQGAVAGGGLGFMLVADIVVASERARFVSKYADIGLTPDCGVSTLLPEAIGVRRALALTLTDLSLDAATAFDWGLVAEVVAPEALGDRVAAIARGWTEGPALAWGQARRLIRARRSYADALHDEARTIGAAFAGPEAGPRIRAFQAQTLSKGRTA